MGEWLGMAVQGLVPAAVAGCGGWFLLRTRGLFGWRKTVREALREKPAEGKIAPRRALALALAGTLGVGNIAGVGSALSLGGPGALFWMALSAVFCMVLKFAETLLALLRRERGSDGTLRGGAMYYMPRRAGVCFSLLCLLCSLTVGNGMQVRAVVTVGEMLLPGRGWIAPAVGTFFAGLLLPVLFGGKRRLFDLAAALVPLMTVGYLLLCGILLVKSRAALPSALGDVFRAAFKPTAAVGGTVGYAVFDGIRRGFLRGLVSNEAGCGTAPIAHASAEGVAPATQGCLGMLEVAVDTLLLCTVTALCVLVTGSYRGGSADGMRVAMAAFTSVLGAPAGWFLLAAVFLFAFATCVSWSYYGREALRFLAAQRTGEKARFPALSRGYALLFSLSALPFSLTDAAPIWAAADLCISLMTLINLRYVMKYRHEILAETRRAGLLR